VVRKKKEKEIHGYAVDPEIFDLGRRPSAISIHPLKRLSDDEWICIVYGFLSKDWPEILYHISLRRIKKRIERREERISISDNLIRDAFETAFNMVITCLCH